MVAVLCRSYADDQPSAVATVLRCTALESVRNSSAAEADPGALCLSVRQ